MQSLELNVVMVVCKSFCILLCFFHVFTLGLFVRFMGFSNALAQQISRYSKNVTKHTPKLSLPLSVPYSSHISGACFVKHIISEL